uniref:Uncharacterized protein n=1 Tax=Ditylum brightwellii TaxID=49249 RepID=A0A7S1ZJH6_9STRA
MNMYHRSTTNPLITTIVLLSLFLHESVVHAFVGSSSSSTTGRISQSTASPSSSKASTFKDVPSILTFSTSSLTSNTEIQTMLTNYYEKTHITYSTSTTLYLSSSDSKWDNLIDEDYDDEGELSEYEKLYPDMKYELKNMKRQANTFDALVHVGGDDVVNDVYLQKTNSNSGEGLDGMELWLVGKIARISDVSPEQAIERQWPLIERHAWTLRLPLFDFSSTTTTTTTSLSLPSMTVWYAPGNTEYEAASNDPSVIFTKVKPELCNGASSVKNSFVGFVGKAYGEGEPPLFVYRDEYGRTVLPEIEGEWEDVDDDMEEEEEE